MMIPFVILSAAKDLMPLFLRSFSVFAPQDDAGLRRRVG
jgi:hypothetical protein